MKVIRVGFIWCDWRSAMVIAKGFERNQEYGLRLAQMLYHYREMPGNGAPFRSSVDMLAYVRGFKSDGHRVPNTTHNLISKYWYYGKHEFHPSEKDVEIVKMLLNWCSDKGSIVLDPFMGSGTVPIACAQSGRQFIGFDISEDFFEIAKGRLEKESMPKINGLQFQQPQSLLFNMSEVEKK
jgi:site-specific DNA-methyltransferase (adenine-specific)